MKGVQTSKPKSNHSWNGVVSKTAHIIFFIDTLKRIIQKKSGLDEEEEGKKKVKNWIIEENIQVWLSM